MEAAIGSANDAPLLSNWDCLRVSTFRRNASSCCRNWFAVRTAIGFGDRQDLERWHFGLGNRDKLERRHCSREYRQRRF